MSTREWMRTKEGTGRTQKSIKTGNDWKTMRIAEVWGIGMTEKRRGLGEWEEDPRNSKA